MSSISSGTGIASGLDIASLIQQLLASDAQRRVPLQSRLSQITQTRTALQESRSLLLALRSSANALALPSTLSATSIASSMPNILSAIASGNGAASIGTTSLLVRSLASASRFASASLASSTASIGASAATIRFGGGRLDDDRSLSLINGGAGFARGRIRITDRSGQQATIDLRDALSINDVMRAINERDDLDIEARLRSDGRGLEVIDTSGGSGTLKIQELSGGTTAASLGILGSDVDADGTMTGSTIASLGTATPLWSLRGGVSIVDGSADFVITVGDQKISIDLGAGPSGSPPRAATLGEALERINKTLDAAGVANQLSIAIAPTGDRLRITTNSSATIAFAAPSGSAGEGVLSALGLPTTAIPGSSDPLAGQIIDGARLLFGMNDVGFDRLDGGRGLALSGSLTLVDRAGHSVTVDGLESVDSVQTLIARIKDAAASVPGMQLGVGLDAGASRLRIIDKAAGGGSITASGTAADTLGLTTLPSSSGGAQTLQSRDLRRADIGLGTPLSQLTHGTLSGSFRITTASGATAVVAVTPNMTVTDLARAVAASGIPASIQVNALGDAIEVVDHSGIAGSLVVKDEGGGVAAALNLVGSSSTGRIDGTHTIALTLTGSENAAQLATILNGLDGVDAELLSDGSAGHLLMVTASKTGLRNAVSLSLDGADLGFASVAEARDARVLLNPSVGNGTLVTAETNALTGVISGVSLQLNAVSDEVISVSVSPSLQPLKSAVSAFASALSAVVAQLRSATAVDVDAGTRGALYGNSTATRARDALRTLAGRTFGSDGRRLSSLGITIGADGALNFDEAKLATALEGDPDGVRDTLSSNGGVAERFDQLLSALVEPSTGAFDGDDARLVRIADNTNSRIDRIDGAIERRRSILVARFNAMESAIERLRWQQSTLQSMISSLGSGQ